MKSYEEAMHAMQSGVAMEQGRGSRDTEPKHLRVGINCRAVDHAGLVDLLIAKGILTKEEYIAAITARMNEEVADYEKRLSEVMGAKIVLG